jgi:hypothetical protein
VPFVNPLLRRGKTLPIALLAALYQFTLEGVAPLTLMIVRRESPSDFGLRRRGAAKSLVLAIALAVLYDAALSLRAGHVLWVPLRRQPAVRMSLAAGMPLALAGLTVVVFTWGLLEGFFGVYFAKKFAIAINRGEVGWLAPGALAFAAFNGAVHLIVGQGLEGFVESFASGYAIAIIPAVTGNAWGGLLVQTLTNAVGRL